MFLPFPHIDPLLPGPVHGLDFIIIFLQFIIYCSCRKEKKLCFASKLFDSLWSIHQLHAGLGSLTIWHCRRYNLVSLRPPSCTVCVNVFMLVYKHVCVYEWECATGNSSYNFAHACMWGIQAACLALCHVTTKAHHPASWGWPKIKLK